MEESYIPQDEEENLENQLNITQTLTNKQLKKRAKKKAKKMAVKKASAAVAASTVAANENAPTQSLNNLLTSNETIDVTNENDVITTVETIEYKIVPSNLQELQSQSQQQQEQQLQVQQQEKFDNLTMAVQILGNAKQLDESKQFEQALKLYRQGVDMLLEELIERQGTDQSRNYLRDKCNNFMNRIDQLKLIMKLEKQVADKENLKEQQI